MKITFITGHNWETKRQGGFHKFAKYCACENIETVFFSFPRPYYGLFMNREQLNKNIIKKLSKGVQYSIAGSENKILNVTYPTLRLPDGIGKFLPDFFVKWMASHGLKSFKRFAKKFLNETDVFVFESNECVYLLKTLKKIFPKAGIIYRPSDPMVFGTVPQRLKNAEIEMLKNADMNVIVNTEGLEAYRKSIPDFDDCVKSKILSNGVDIESYRKTYITPDELKKENTILYVGAWEVEWKLLFKAAEETPEFNYIVVCPNYPSEEIKKQLVNYKNLTYVPGIKPSEVPAWITNCTVVMVPYVTDFYKDRPLGITAKYYQAMSAHKPIVAYCDTPKLNEAGVPVTYTYEAFIDEVKKAVNEKTKDYSFDISNRDWNKICETFLDYAKSTSAE